jgi:hypothetical protein
MYVNIFVLNDVQASEIEGYTHNTFQWRSVKAMINYKWNICNLFCETFVTYFYFSDSPSS